MLKSLNSFSVGHLARRDVAIINTVLVGETEGRDI
jgi:hypothetical protein